MSSTDVMLGRTSLSLRLRLALLVAAVVAIVIAAEGYLEIRMFEADVEHDLSETANATAREVADEIELRSPGQPGTVTDTLHEFRKANPKAASSVFTPPH